MSYRGGGGGVRTMMTFDDKGGMGVENGQKIDDVIYDG